jgi:endogenous inhibitor of DNA gyrase (YacG/DUF329 family)
MINMDYSRNPNQQKNEGIGGRIENTPCPICGKAIISDATVRKFCRLCGMGIPDPSNVPKQHIKDGRTLYFCCDKCFSIYKIEIAIQQDSET